VSDVVGLLDTGYESIKIYRAGGESSTYSEITVAGTRVSLDLLYERYTYFDTFGSEDSWYKWSYYSATGPIESSLSDAIKGTISGSTFRGKSFPAEVDLTTSQQDTINRIRSYIGDFKTTNRDYMSPETNYENVSTDGKTVTLDNPKGWPLSIVVDSVEYNSIVDPYVNGYEFVTFSGTTITVDVSTVDIWYENFRFSDREILNIYNTVELPPRITTGTVTLEIYEIATAINLLEGELREFTSTSSSKVSIYEEISIDPSAGLNARLKDLENLRKRLKDLVDSIIANNLTMTGVRIE
jgi:hypothetical protein